MASSESGRPGRGSDRTRRFDDLVLPNLPAAYNLARWLLGSETDAEDVVQEACLRAFRFLDGYHGGSPRGWLLAIVRNACYSWLEDHRPETLSTPFDDAVHAGQSDPELEVHETIDHQLVREAMTKLPVEFREAILLREVEGLSYKEIASLAGVPIGTVMSRLARGRKQLQSMIAGGLYQRRESHGTP